MDKKEIVKAVVEQLSNMLENNTIHENGFESFEGWCADGEVFTNNGMSDEDADKCMDLVRKVSPDLDNLIWKYLSIESCEEE